MTEQAVDVPRSLVDPETGRHFCVVGYHVEACGFKVFTCSDLGYHAPTFNKLNPLVNRARVLTNEVPEDE